MQTMEAVLSLLFFILLTSQFLMLSDGQKIDDSLYRIQLAEDSWRVLYLRGDFKDFNDGKRAFIEKEFAAIAEETGFCIFMDGIQFTNCRDSQEHEIISSLSKTIIYDGKPRKVTFSIGI